MTPSAMTDAPDAALNIPEGFKPRRFGDGFIAVNGPLYVKKLVPGILLGFRVEARHCNPMGICHGGMIATFCDMLLPISAHYLSADLARRFLPTISLQVDYLAASKRGAWVQGEAQLLRATRSMVSTSCTRTISAPRAIPTEIAAAVPSMRWSGGKFRV